MSYAINTRAENLLEVMRDELEHARQLELAGQHEQATRMVKLAASTLEISMKCRERLYLDDLVYILGATDYRVHPSGSITLEWR